jgi:hypothetical protein
MTFSGKLNLSSATPASNEYVRMVPIIARLSEKTLSFIFAISFTHRGARPALDECVMAAGDGRAGHES